jgi:hypothetical protein
MISPHAPEETCAAACAKPHLCQYWIGGVAVADFCGMQEDADGGQFALWNLLVPCGPHPVNSTVTAATIEKYL